MAVAPSSMADKIIVLDDEEESPQPSCSASTSSSNHQAKKFSQLKAQQPAPTHITESPFATAKKKTHVLQAENERLFTEFVEHCSPLTQDCPEVLSFLQTKHAKATPEFLTSVEFRNTLGRCLTRAQANRSKTFVYINELCTVLRQHSGKRRQSLSRVEPGPSTSSGSLQSTSVPLKKEDKTTVKMTEEDGVQQGMEEQPSTSGIQDDNKDDAEAVKKAKRKLKKQIAYLENLLKVYNEEIHRLQEAELSLDDMGAEDSLYIQENSLKRKMMKIYEKLCELKGCSTLTGRVIEHRITYKGTRYPEINKRIERFINSPDAQKNTPDYQDILHQVRRATERHNLCLSKKQQSDIAKEAFRETASSMQERRHLDLVYNFGSHLTDEYKLGKDPALSDSSLQRKLRTNRELALSRLEEVITKYSVKQEDTEERERNTHSQKDRKDKEGKKSKNMNGVEEQEEEEQQQEEEEDDDDDDEEDESSDPDIEEEIKASTQQEGPDDGSDEDDSNEAGDGDDNDNEESGSVSMKEEGSVKDEEEPVTSEVSPKPGPNRRLISPLSDMPSPMDSPSQSEPMEADDQRLLSNGIPARTEEPVDSSNQVSVVLVTTSKATEGTADASTMAANGVPVPLAPTVIIKPSDTQTNGRSPPPSPRTTRSRKRKREDMTSGTAENHKHIITNDSETDITLDMGVFCYGSPQRAESTRADTPTHDLVSSSQSTPPPKKNKVNVATQCDPLEVIVLSDSE